MPRCALASPASPLLEEPPSGGLAQESQSHGVPWLRAQPCDGLRPPGASPGILAGPGGTCARRGLRVCPGHWAPGAWPTGPGRCSASVCLVAADGGLSWAAWLSVCLSVFFGGNETRAHACQASALPLSHVPRLRTCTGLAAPWSLAISQQAADVGLEVVVRIQGFLSLPESPGCGAAGRCRCPQEAGTGRGPGVPAQPPLGCPLLDGCAFSTWTSLDTMPGCFVCLEPAGSQPPS